MPKAFAKRIDKGKKKEISPVDAAVLIQLSFKAYLIRRSKALRALRELAVAKTKLKELRALFHNFSYRSRVSRDAEERQKFAEKIIVLLLTVDAIEVRTCFTDWSWYRVHLFLKKFYPANSANSDYYSANC